MTYREEETVTHTDAHAEPAHGSSVAHREVTYRSSPMAVAERLIVFIFGLIQLLLVVRIVLLLLAARQGNDLVAAIYNVSEIFVAPFRGILRIDEVAAGATALDIGAIVALVGWTIVELILIGLVRVFRPSATA
jgi:uncharacterized protein YggT (Ycf19 family)